MPLFHAACGRELGGRREGREEDGGRPKEHAFNNNKKSIQYIFGPFFPFCFFLVVILPPTPYKISLSIFFCGALSFLLHGKDRGREREREKARERENKRQRKAGKVKRENLSSWERDARSPPLPSFARETLSLSQTTTTTTTTPPPRLSFLTALAAAWPRRRSQRPSSPRPPASSPR